MWVSHKSISWNSDPLKRTWLFFKDSTEKWNTVLMFNNTLTYPNQIFLFSEECICVSHKSISWNSYPLKRTWLSFKVNLLHRKGTLLKLLNILCHIPNNGLTFQRNTCAFLTRAFHEILTHQTMRLSFKVKLHREKEPCSHF